MPYIWRKTRSGPRYACTIEEAPASSDGFNVTDSDPEVCDPGFLHDLHEHMIRPVSVSGSSIVDGMRAQTAWTAHLKEHGHFEAAIRSIPHAALGAAGRS